ARCAAWSTGVLGRGPLRPSRNPMPWVVTMGSGKVGTPWLRMHATNRSAWSVACRLIPSPFAAWSITDGTSMDGGHQGTARAACEFGVNPGTSGQDGLGVDAGRVKLGRPTDYEVPARAHLGAHEQVKDGTRLGGVFDPDPAQHPVPWVHGGLRELAGIHLT